MTDQKIVRFDGTGKMVRDEAGYFVKHSDYAEARASISRLTAERDGLRSAASDLLAAFDSDDVMGMRGDTVVLRVSFKSLMERLRHAATPTESDALAGGSK